MSSARYPVGTRLYHVNTGIRGEVTENRKMPGDICVQWDNGQFISYDEEFLDDLVATRLIFVGHPDDVQDPKPPV